MAMLALLELLADAGTSEEDMYKYALSVNAYWFSDTYMTIAKFMESKGTAWEEVDPREILGADYSSASGFRKVLSAVSPEQNVGGGSCGV